MSDNIEAFFEELARQTERSNALLHDKQKAITWGSEFIRFHDVSHRIIIFGHVYTQEELFDLEGGDAASKIADPVQREIELSEVQYTIERLTEAHARGYLYGWCSSIIEPGEPGSTHRSWMWPISTGLYNAAKAVDWRIDALGRDDARQVERAYRQYRDWLVTARQGVN